MKKNVFINKNKKKYYYWIDLLRWVAALGIVFIHYQTLIFKTWQNYFDRSIQPLYEFFWFFYEFGGYGVWFFWIISGFVFTNLYINLNTSKKEFFIARFARLYPLHFLTLIIVLTLQIYSFFNFKEYQIYFVNDFYHFILNIFFISKWGLETGESFNYPIWSVSVELLILFFFIFTLSFLKKLKIFLPIIMIIISKVFLYTIPFTAYEIYTCFFYFFSGSFLFFIKDSFDKFGNKKSLVYLGFFVVSILLMTLEQEFKEMGGFFSTFEKIIPTTVIIFSSIILFATSLDDILPSLGKKIKILGESSYSIYLTHIPINISLLIIIKQFNINKSIFFNEYFFILYLLFLQSLSILTFLFFEYPMRKKIKNNFSIFR